MQPAQNKVFLLSMCPAPPRAHLTPKHSQMLPVCDKQLQLKVSPSLIQTEACKQSQKASWICFIFKEQQEQIFSFYHLIMYPAKGFKNIPLCLVLIFKTVIRGYFGQNMAFCSDVRLIK